MHTVTVNYSANYSVTTPITPTTGPTESNGDLKQVGNGRKKIDISQCDNKFPVDAEILKEVPVKGIQSPCIKKSVCCVKSAADIEPTGGLGRESAGSVRSTSSQ